MWHRFFYQWLTQLPVRAAAALRDAWRCLMNPQCWAGTLWRWGRVFWVCRVPAISALAGGFLLAGTAQARDLFADLGLQWWQWGLFFVCLLGWVTIVHASARRAVLSDHWVPDAHCPGGLSASRRVALRS
jgi:hypothetical protein